MFMLTPLICGSHQLCRLAKVLYKRCATGWLSTDVLPSLSGKMWSLAMHFESAVTLDLAH